MKTKHTEHDILVFMYLYRIYVNPHLYKKALSLEANRPRSGALKLYNPRGPF